MLAMSWTSWSILSFLVLLLMTSIGLGIFHVVMDWSEASAAASQQSNMEADEDPFDWERQTRIIEALRDRDRRSEAARRGWETRKRKAAGKDLPEDVPPLRTAARRYEDDL